MKKIEEEKVYYVTDTVTGAKVGPFNSRSFVQSIVDRSNNQHTGNPIELSGEGYKYAKKRNEATNVDSTC